MILSLFFILFASMIHIEIWLRGIPVFFARFFGDRFAKSAIVLTPAISNSLALFVPMPGIFVRLLCFVVFFGFFVVFLDLVTALVVLIVLNVGVSVLGSSKGLFL